MRKILTLIVGISVFAGFSCKKILNQEPKNSTYNEVFWADARAGENAIAGNYALLRDVLSTGLYNSYNRYYMYGDAATGIEYSLRNEDGQGFTDVVNGRFGGNYASVAMGDWTGYYKTIAMSNIIVKNMEEVPISLLETSNTISDPEEYKKNIIGQALFIRALTYFMMVRIWGDVPLVTEAYDDPINAPHLGRSPKVEVMDQIEEDCIEALQNLKWSYYTTGDRSVTANKSAVYALLAHLYLWRATVADVNSDSPDLGYVDKALNAIEEIENNGNYSLTDTSNYYQTFIGRSSESIFEINKSEDTQEGTRENIGAKFLDNRYVDYFPSTAYYYVNPSYLSTHFYKISSDWDWVWNTDLEEWEWMEVTAKELDQNDIRIRKNFDDILSSYPTCIKYSNIIYREPGQKLDGYFSNNMNIFRLSDMILLKAEIALYKGQKQVAIEIINDFRKRNNSDPSSFVDQSATPDQVMDEYIIERGKELYLEGHLFYDLIRTRKSYDLIPWMDETRFRREGFYWPVSPNLFKENKFLVQTEYWRGKV